MLVKSTPIIIGQTIAQIRMATGKFTFAYSSPASVSNRPGMIRLRPIPARMDAATQTDRWCSKTPMPLAAAKRHEARLRPAAIDRAVADRMKDFPRHA